MSRIDRIYANPTIGKSLSNWTVETSEIPSDHKMTSVRFAPEKAPFIGKGRWSWPLGLLHNKPLNQTICTLGIEPQDQLQRTIPNDRSSNAQTLWQEFKDKIKEEATAAAKLQMCQISKHITKLQDDLKEARRVPTLDDDEPSRLNIIALEREIDYLMKKRYKTAYNKAQTQWFMKGEQVNKYWSKVNNPRTPRDLIYRLIHPDTREAITRSDKMAELARDYHENIQTEGLLDPTATPRQAAISEALDSIPYCQKLANPHLSLLSSEITHKFLESALRLSKRGSAAGPSAT